MDKIVKNALKVDFHIHSYASYHKDHNDVKDSKIENLPTLISKLNENCVNMLAITDHDNFDYELYSKLKSEESNNENSIKKVLPGIEFSVTIQEQVLHIVAIFDDSEDDKVKKIQSYLYDCATNKPLYNYNDSFSEEKFIEILRNIDIDVILIAHQKESLGSKKQRKHDANSLGCEELEKLVFIDYFEAYEFKNKRNEIFNKHYIENQNQKLKDMKFVTGSDCHNWNNYPEKNIESFEFCYFKCLPTFRGAMMAITDSSRIKIGVSSFFSVNAPISNIELLIENKEYNIELSKGINAIIGDNSVGKSLLLHKLTDYREINNETRLKTAYDNYLCENHIEVITRIKSEDIRNFDKQGNIRNLFINNRTKSKDFLKEYYPIEPNYNIQKTIVTEKVEEFICFMQNKKAFLDESKKINNIKFLRQDESMSLQINKITIDLNKKISDYSNLVLEIEGIVLNTKKLTDKNLLDEEEKIKIKEFIEYLNNLAKKYAKIKESFEIEEKKIQTINSKLINLVSELNKTKTEIQKNKEAYNLKFTQLANTIKNLVKIRQNTSTFDENVKEFDLQPNINVNGEYRFVSKSSISRIDSNYIFELIKYPLNANYKKKIKKINDIIPNEFEENIKTGNEEPEDIYDFYKKIVVDKLDDDLKPKYSINKSTDKDITKELSSGANAQIYFDLLSNDSAKPGIYIIDQPEDDVSQPSIKSKLLNNFKTLSENRQILLVTHNPQFIVNLDVDNVIFIKRDDKSHKISIENGALEYKDEKTDILKIVADNIEGGIDSLKERYKKYEKNN